LFEYMALPAMEPSDFFLTYYSKVLVAPFLDPSLYKAALNESLGLKPNDKTSIPKLRVSGISMAIFLGSRAVREAAIVKFSHGFSSVEAIASVANNAEVLADAIIDEARESTLSPSLPAYVDELYFPKWKGRYQQRAQAQKQGELRYATIAACFGQCTFPYENESAVMSTDDQILNEITTIYDTYVGALRSLLGEEVLY
jgi:hypothetical protein